jgi:hypothetical protein
MKKRIYIKEWLAIKPYDRKVSTDTYYLKLCNEVKDILIDHDEFALSLGNEIINFLSCFLVSYFEDIISGTNIWNTFVKKHTEMYGKKLPFYPAHEYYENEINEADVTFLIWYYLDTIKKEAFINPYAKFIADAAKDVMSLFDQHYEYAPENEVLMSYYMIDKNETDYYEVRNIINNILFNTYLFHTDTNFRLIESEKDIIESDPNNENLIAYLNENMDTFVHGRCTRLLGMKGKEWAAEILGKSHPLFDDLNNISKKILGFFLYKGQDETDVTVEHIATGKKFLLTKKSFDQHTDLHEIDTIMLMGIVRWKDEWWFSGVYVQLEYNEELVQKERASENGRKAVAFLDHGVMGLESLKMQEQAFLEFNNNSHIAFLPAEKIDGFLQDFMEEYNKSLNIPINKLEESRKRVRDEGYSTEENQKPVLPEIKDPGVVFFNPRSGCEISWGILNAFPDKENPFFNKEESEDDVFFLLMAKDISKELAMYCIDNYKDKLPFFETDKGAKYLEDIDFLLRYWKMEKYHSEPSLFYV